MLVSYSTPKKGIQAFFAWINERHQIYLNKQAGLPKPWTMDWILQQYKFCNVFRELDTGTIWLRKHWIEPCWAEKGRLLFHIVLYRMFNHIPTAEFLGEQLEWDEKKVIKQLKKRMKEGNTIFTSAHMLRGMAGKSKIESFCKTLTKVWEDKEACWAVIESEPLLEKAFYMCAQYPLIGSFLSYEMVTDLRHTPLLEKALDINTWANVGPGAKRGLQRIWPKNAPQNGLIQMRELLEVSPHFRGDHVPILELRDIEHSLCEFDKWSRVKFGEGRPRVRYNGLP